jgi:hypothetical protein
MACIVANWIFLTDNQVAMHFIVLRFEMLGIFQNEQNIRESSKLRKRKYKPQLASDILDLF